MSKNLKILLFVVAIGTVVYFFMDSRGGMSDCIRQASKAMLENEKSARAENWNQEKICKNLKPIIRDEVSCVQKHYKGSMFADKEIEGKFKLEAMLMVRDFNAACPGYEVEVPKF